MAPVKAKDPSIERTTEYDEFIGELAAYHEKRG
jgi:chromatin structure-remodeling complex subunit RSC9